MVSRSPYETPKTFAAHVLRFYARIVPPRQLPRGVEALFPYRDPVVRYCMERYYTEFFSDTSPRVFVLGINPGRFGAGVSGIPFTDGVTLEQTYGITSDLPKRRELSAIFVQAFIERWGGAARFYHTFFITATSPIGFTRAGKNVNYYDSPDLFAATRPFIVRTLRRQLEFGARRDVAIVLGTGRNHAALTALNEKHRFFGELLVVEHPRFIMQYRRKKLREYLDRYERVFTLAASRASS